jgi:putative acetyltransferase
VPGPDIEIRPGGPADAEAIAEAHRDSICSIGPRFYPPEVVDEWQSGLAPEMYIDAMTCGEAFFVAIGLVGGDRRVLGFSTHRVDDDQDGLSVYVRGSAARRGIGTALLQRSEAHARSHGASSLQIQASLAGVEFYRVNGFEELGRGDARLLSGRTMPCVFMRKVLAPLSIDIRPETPDDILAIREIHRLAFGQDLEGRIVDSLRANGAATLSLVATLDGTVVGHIIYSPLVVGDITGAGLGPVGVLPAYQRQGVGSRLVEAGNEELRRQGCPCIAVLGHPTYYPRFGFTRASAYGIRCEWSVPDDVFMMLVLDAGVMAGVCGLARYRPEFSSAT